MKTLLVALMIMALVLVPSMVIAGDYATSKNAPISQTLVREGTVAVRMVEVFKLGTTTNEAEAENVLISAGIAPHAGWISDYPVTPDIANELRTAVSDAADSGSLKLGREMALQTFDGVLAGYNLMIKADPSGWVTDKEQASVYPDNTVINNYYYTGDPPAVTYYAPPVDYAYLYSWVPYPFWWWDVWFPGFFVLADFHRVVFVNGRAFFCSSHFFDDRLHAFVRFDHSGRFHDRFFADSRNVVNNPRFVNNRVVGPSAVRSGAEHAFRAESSHVRFDSVRSSTTFRGSGVTRNAMSSLNTGSRTFVPSTGSRAFNTSVRRERGSVPSFERGRNFNWQPERTFRSGPVMSGNRWFSSTQRTFIAPVTHRSFSSPSTGGMRGWSVGGSFRGRHM